MDKFREKDKIRVKESSDSPTKRTPFYVRGKVGTVDVCYGTVLEPDFDRDHRVSWGPLYRVVFEWLDVYGGSAFQNSKFFLDLHEGWLEPS